MVDYLNVQFSSEKDRKPAPFFKKNCSTAQCIEEPTPQDRNQCLSYKLEGACQSTACRNPIMKSYATMRFPLPVIMQVDLNFQEG